MGNLISEVDGTEGESAEKLVAKLEMEVEGSADEVEVRGGGGLLSLEAVGILTQEAETCGTMLVGSCNMLNDLSHLVILCIVQHHWPAWSRFSFNCYKYWTQILL